MLRPTQYHFRKTETPTQGCFEAEIKGKPESCKKKNRCSGKQNATKAVSFQTTFSITYQTENGNKKRDHPGKVIRMISLTYIELLCIATVLL